MGFQIELDGATYDVEILELRPLRLRVDNHECVVTTLDSGADGRRTIAIDGKPFSFARAHVGARQFLRLDGRTLEARLIDPRDAADAGTAGHDHVRAPMPGTIVCIHKQPGDAVSRGEALVTIESMKLQMTLSAPRDGILASLTRGVGETFDKDEIVAELELLSGD